MLVSAVGMSALAAVTVLTTPVPAAAADPATGTGPWQHWSGPFGEPAPGGDASRSTLVLYDGGGKQPWVGESEGVQAAQLASRGSRVSLAPIASYQRGEVNRFTGMIYASSDSGQVLPPAFLDDVAGAAVPVLWLGGDPSPLIARHPDAAVVKGWRVGDVDVVPVAVSYRGQRLVRDPENGPTLRRVELTRNSKAQVLADAIWPDGSRTPYVVRAGNLIYVADIPFDYVGTSDRYLASADLIRQIAEPDVPDRHRALVRLEDISPRSDPTQLRQIADYLYSVGVPFSIALFPYYIDPSGKDDGGKPTSLRLADTPNVVEAIKYMVSRGGTLVLHGYSHQYGEKDNPYDGTSGSDYEFFLAHVDNRNNVQLDRPVPGDSAAWSTDRLQRGRAEIARVGLPEPGAFEFPHYAASAADYAAANVVFGVRYDQGTYFGGYCQNGRCGAGSPDPAELYQQYFPYPVRDVYNSVVIPEDLGNIAPNAYNNHAARLPVDIIAAAKAMSVVRDGIASFFYHPYLGVDLLRQTVHGIQGLGYTFIPAQSVLDDFTRGAPLVSPAPMQDRPASSHAAPPREGTGPVAAPDAVIPRAQSRRRRQVRALTRPPG